MNLGQNTRRPERVSSSYDRRNSNLYRNWKLLTLSIKIGIAPGTWGIRYPDHPAQVPWSQLLDEVAEAGYEWIETGPYGYMPTDTSIFRAELQKRDIKVIATTVMLGHLEEPSAWPALEKEVTGAGELGASVNAKFLILIDDYYTNLFDGTPKPAKNLDHDAWKRVIDTTHRIADISRDHFNLQLVFHPHAETHIETESQIETFLQHTDPSRVGLCLDTGHHSYAGGDPVAFFRKHHNRVAYMHLKTLDSAVYDRARAEHMSIKDASEIGVFCDLDYGTIDFQCLGSILNEVDFDGWVMVEQDTWDPPAGVPLAVAKRTGEYLKEVGWI